MQRVVARLALIRHNSASLLSIMGVIIPCNTQMQTRLPHMLHIVSLIGR